MALRNPSDDKPKDGSGRKAFFQNVAAIFGQYGLQCFFGLLATLVMMVTVFPDLFPAIGLTLPLGFELGPGQAYSMTAPWEPLGFEGGTSVGLAMAAAGFIVGSIGGVILINIGIRKGWLDKKHAEALRTRSLFSGFLPKGGSREGSRLTSEGESIDTLSYHVALIMASSSADTISESGVPHLLLYDQFRATAAQTNISTASIVRFLLRFFMFAYSP